jgi:diphthamide synthase (EF-2-diphthine--ammonia ligase)
MKVAVLWNGDKSSAFAFGNVKGDFDISFLLTFLTKGCFNASLLSSIRLQCDKIRVPFFLAKMKTARPEEYREIISELREDYGIEAIVSDGSQSLVEDACGAAGMKVIKA